MDIFLQAFVPALETTFGERIRFAGLQGSRARDEHRPDSDYDMVVVLDRLTPADISAYREMLAGLPKAELACGFLCGQEELLAWDPADLFSLCIDTTPIRGSLKDAWARVDDAACRAAAHNGACAVYHACVHNMIYRRSARTLEGLLKQAVFVIRAAQYVRTGLRQRTLADLQEHASVREAEVLERYTDARTGRRQDFAAASDALFAWAKEEVLAENSR